MVWSSRRENPPGEEYAAGAEEGIAEGLHTAQGRAAVSCAPEYQPHPMVRSAMLMLME